MTEKIILSPKALEKAIRIGTERDEETKAKGGVHNFEPPAGWAPHAGSIMGVKSEMAVALYLDMKWGQTVGNIRAVDVGGMVEVRAVSTYGKPLRIRRKDVHGDARQRPFVLCEVSPDIDSAEVKIIGWAFPGEAVGVQFWKATPTGRKNRNTGEDEVHEAWYLPQSELHPMAWLKSMRAIWTHVPPVNGEQA